MGDGADLVSLLSCARGVRVRHQSDSGGRAYYADSLTEAFDADAENIAAVIGRCALDELLAAHRLWSEWLATGRVRKFGVVAERL